MGSALVCENRETDFGAKSLHDVDDQGTADAPLVAHGEFNRRGKGLREQRGTGLAYDDGSQKALSGPSKPGVTASKMANGAVQTMSQPQKITTMRRR